MKIIFSKLSGSGNDFIVIDNRALSIQLTPMQIKELCTRRTGIGADGLIYIEPSANYDFSMKYHNSDGFPGSMCGNGGRCAVYFAHSKGIAASSELNYEFEANNNHYNAWIIDHESVKLQMLPPEEFINDMNIEGFICHSVNTGSPHVIIYVLDLNKVKVTEIGRFIRHKTDFFPQGTNVNFVQINSPDTLAIRTFERGVEDETLSCGTGAVAAALMTYRIGKTKNTSLKIKVRSGDTLHVNFSENMHEVFLTGPAKIIFEGNFDIDLKNP